MSLRKLAGLLAAFGLTVGLIGGGVGAVFHDQVTATENIDVGTFACTIVNPSSGVIAADGKSVTYTAPTIMSSAAGSAPFSFTVQNTGSINQVLTVAMTGQTGNLGGHFSAMPATPSPVALAAGASQAISTGIQWAELVNDDLGRSGSMTWTVNCGEVPPPTQLIHYTFKSTNADNIAGTVPGHGTTIGPNVVAVDNGPGSITLNFTTGPTENYYATCFEYVTDGNVPEQKLAENGGVNYNNGTSDGDPIVLDGLFPYVCLYSGHTTDSVTLTGISNVQVRSAFGAESDYRFDWTQFNAL